MSNLQEQAEKVWDVLDDLVLTRFCGQECGQCPVSTTKYPSPNCGDKESLRNWLHINGFPASRPHVHTVAELAQQIIKGSSVPCLTQRIAQNVEAVACPDCGKHTLYRERRMVCAGCNSVYPADKWANGEPCEACGCMDARYYGVHSTNRLGQLEFQQCSPGCHWGGDYRRLTVQELADAAQEAADAQRMNARDCPDYGETSGSDQREGVYLPIERCGCGLQTPEPEGEEK